MKLFNLTNVVLIPKINGPQKVSDFCLISLCNVVYKVVTKFLVIHLKAVLRIIVFEEQSAFVLGLLILDNVIVAFEVLHSLRRKIGGVLWSLN